MKEYYAFALMLYVVSGVLLYLPLQLMDEVKSKIMNVLYLPFYLLLNIEKYVLIKVFKI